ncbi:DUF6301 family protein [Rhizomonospora bruguierae]|uniref:DUF6301 family protein n=1 Tax=Rhizomonospora bruguierae TaxID=1581705 RepID=UPI001BD0B785|nr:DUF6301 family protein [Micromonospora sp. NBRC 107566]
MPRWRASDLAAPDVQAHTWDVLYLGSDGNQHFVGDRIGTWRDRLSCYLHNANGYTAEDNRPLPFYVQAPAVPLARVSFGYNTTGAALARRLVLDEYGAAETKEVIWRHRVDPIAGALRRAGLTVDRTTFGGGAVTKALAGAREALTPAERLQARRAAADYARAGDLSGRISCFVGYTTHTAAEPAVELIEYRLDYARPRPVHRFDGRRLDVGGTLRTIGAAQARRLLIALLDRSFGWTLAEVPRLMRHLAWALTEVIPEAGVAVQMDADRADAPLQEGSVQSITICATNRAAGGLADRFAVLDVFESLYAGATGMLGPATTVIPGDVPCAQWRGAVATVTIDNARVGVFIDWCRNEYLESSDADRSRT